MFQRGAGPTEYEGCDPEVAFQDEVEDMFAENLVSGSRASILLGKAQKAGLKLAGKFIKKLPGKSKKWKKNAARDMRRRIRKNRNDLGIDAMPNMSHRSHRRRFMPNGGGGYL